MKRWTVLWILIFVVGAGIVYLPPVSKYLKLKRRERELQRSIDRLQGEIAQLKRDEHLLKTDLTRLEEVIREELGLVRPGEVVVKVVEEEIPQTVTQAPQKAQR